MAKTYTNEDVLNDLKERCNRSTQKAVAESIGVSVQHINDVLFRRRNLSEHVARGLGYERVFRKRAA